MYLGITLQVLWKFHCSCGSGTTLDVVGEYPSPLTHTRIRTPKDNIHIHRIGQVIVHPVRVHMLLAIWKVWRCTCNAQQRQYWCNTTFRASVLSLSGAVCGAMEVGRLMLEAIRNVVLEAGIKGGTPNSIAPILWDVVICPYTWYLLLTKHSSYRSAYGYALATSLI